MDDEIIYTYIGGEKRTVASIPTPEAVVTPSIQMVKAIQWLYNNYRKKPRLHGKELFIEVDNEDGTKEEKSLKFYTDNFN